MQSARLVAAVAELGSLGRLTMLTPLEKAVLDTLLDKPGAPFDTIRQQLSHAAVAKREFTGVGFFTEFTLPADAPVSRDLSDETIGGVGASFPEERSAGQRHLRLAGGSRPGAPRVPRVDAAHVKAVVVHSRASDPIERILTPLVLADRGGARRLRHFTVRKPAGHWIHPDPLGR